MLLFREVAEVFLEIEKRSGRLEMTDLLATLFKHADAQEINKLIYLVQGIPAPPYEGIDLGMGEQFAIRAIAAATGYGMAEVEKHYKKSGDLGITVHELIGKKKQQSLSVRQMDINYVYSAFLKIAQTAGKGSQELKIKYLAELLNNASPSAARFIVRFALGRLRLGVGDPTILDALSVAKTGDKSLREPLERAYNVCADMGYVARIFYETPKKIARFKVQPFKPLMPALAERLSTPEEIVDKIGECAIEKKFDGFRLQVHKQGNRVALYSRKLEDMTNMFPDVVKAVQQLKAKEIIFEGEALAYNEKQGRYYSFQQTMHRRRKHGIEAASRELPLNVFCFDLLYLNGKDFTLQPYAQRRKQLEKLFPKNILKLSEKTNVKTGSELEKIFQESLTQGLEGIMAKDLNAQYTAGKRKFAWIKLKKSYGKALDTIDAVIVGYFLGKGARAEFEFGGLLVAVRNEDTQKLETVAKVGSGYTEEEMGQLQKLLECIQTTAPPSQLAFNEAQQPDFWVEPKYVVEVAFDEITESPTHTCGMHGGKGYALRFPRMSKFREDKSIREATTTQEVIELYHRQRK